MVRIAICDDDAVCLQHTCSLVEKWSATCQVPVQLIRFENGDDLLQKAAVRSFDIIFLDIMMPLLDGMETARELRQSNNTSKIIFLTSSSEFAVESYSVRADNYLLKPVDYEQLRAALDHCLSTQQEEAKHLVLKTAGGFQKIYLHDIEFVEAQNKKIVFFLRNGKTLEVGQPLRTFEDQLLAEDGFFGCHRSYLVNLANISFFNSLSIQTKCGRTVPVARGTAKAFEQAYFAFVFHE